MKYALLYEFRDTDDNGLPEAVISRYNDGYSPDRTPDNVVTVSASSDKDKYDKAQGVDDVEGDDDIDEDDESYYLLAADLASALVTLSSVGEKRIYKNILLSFGNNSKNAALPDVNIDMFKVSNSAMTHPDSTVTVTGYNRGLYKDVVDATDADGDGDTDLDDQLIYRRIGNSFASMRDFKV